MDRLVVLDFDGTMSDAEAEGRPFTQGYLEDLAAIVGRPLDEVLALAARFEAEVLAEPQRYGWLFGGRIVCPGTVDPYQRVMPVARKILDVCGVIPDEATRARLLEGVLFKYNYRKTVRAFRPHAAQALAALKPFVTWVATNAHVEPVRAKVLELDAQLGGGELAWLADRLRGRAMKQVVDDTTCLDLPAELRLPGLSRPVLVRRPRYRALLDELRGDLPWSQVFAVGDIFELDLCLPLALGANVVLAANEFTPRWELDYVAAHPRGRVVRDLRHLAPLIAGWPEAR